MMTEKGKRGETLSTSRLHPIQYIYLETKENYSTNYQVRFKKIMVMVKIDTSCYFLA